MRVHSKFFRGLFKSPPAFKFFLLFLGIRFACQFFNNPFFPFLSFPLLFPLSLSLSLPFFLFFFPFFLFPFPKEGGYAKSIKGQTSPTQNTDKGQKAHVDKEEKRKKRKKEKKWKRKGGLSESIHDRTRKTVNEGCEG
jgi:hypothetical protein